MFLSRMKNARIMLCIWNIRNHVLATIVKRVLFSVFQPNVPILARTFHFSTERPIFEVNVPFVFERFVFVLNVPFSTWTVRFIFKRPVSHLNGSFCIQTTRFSFERSIFCLNGSFFIQTTRFSLNILFLEWMICLDCKWPVLSVIDPFWIFTTYFGIERLE